MALASTSLAPSLLSTDPMICKTPMEVTQQLQRVETLHQQLKAETQRAQEFLSKLRRSEVEAQTQAQLQLEQRQRERDEAAQQHHESGHQIDKGRQSSFHSKSTDTCQCNCAHHPAPARHQAEKPQISTNGGPLTAEYAHAHHHDLEHDQYDGHSHPRFYPDHHSGYNGKVCETGDDMTIAPLRLPTRVDEREVRDLEKRVRGLEGRVRGFEGLPPDREVALLEVERLRKELEGLARRREGLFEGLGGMAGVNYGLAEAAAAVKLGKAIADCGGTDKAKKQGLVAPPDLHASNSSGRRAAKSAKKGLDT